MREGRYGAVGGGSDSGDGEEKEGALL